jgi:hypothetical protein
MGAGLSLGLHVLQQLSETLRLAGKRTWLNDNLRVHKILSVIDFGGVLNFLKIRGFGGVIRPLLGINKVELGFRIL